MRAGRLRHGFGQPRILSYTEEGGCLGGADADEVSKRARERGSTQIGTLGGGNHFLELDVIDEVFLPEIAAVYGLEEGDLALFIHSGSRGLGYQVCDDFLAGHGQGYAEVRDRVAGPTAGVCPAQVR